MSATPQIVTEPLDPRPIVRWRWLVWPYWIALAISTHWPNVSLGLIDRDFPLREVLQADKPIHFTLFAGLMALLLRSGVCGRSTDWSGQCRRALIIVSIYALIDELGQWSIPGRGVTASDYLSNLLGILSVYVLALSPREQAPGPIPRRLVGVLVVGIPLMIFMLTTTKAVDLMFDLAQMIQGRRPVGMHPMDTIGHGLFAQVLAMVVISIWPLRCRHPRRTGAVVILVLLLLAPAIEIVQYYAGRSCEPSDIQAHETGVLVALGWWAWRLSKLPANKAPSLSTTNAATSPSMTPSISAQAVPDSDTPSQASASSVSSASGFVGHAALVSLLTLISRFTGLARDAVLAGALGLSVTADAFFVGFLVPNLFRRLFGEGALTASFIPSYTDLIERDPSLAKRFASLTLTLLSVLLIGITLVCEIVLWRASDVIDPEHKASLAIYYTRIMLPYMPMVCIVAMLGGVLQVHKRFGSPAAAPLILNGGMILAVVLAHSLAGDDPDKSRVATWVAVSVLVSGVIQLVWQLVAMMRVTGLTTHFAGCWPSMKSMLLLMGPMVVGLAVFQINSMLDTMIAYFFAPADGPGHTTLSFLGMTFEPPLRQGDVAALNWSQRLYQFPLGVFGIAIATAIFPALSSAAAKSNSKDLGNGRLIVSASEAFANIVRQGLRLTIFIGLPASVGLILIRVPLSRTVFEHGDFSTQDALRVATILAGYASSIWAYSMTHTLTRAFYALKDAKTPLRVSMGMVALNLALNVTLIWPLGAVGLAWSTAASAVGQVLLLLLMLRKRVHNTIDRSVMMSWARTALASAVMALVILPITYFYDPAGLSKQVNYALLAGLVVLGGVVVLAVAWFSRAEELQWLRRRSVR